MNLDIIDKNKISKRKKNVIETKRAHLLKIIYFINSNSKRSEMV